MNVAQLFLHQATERPDAPAIVEEAREATFGELERASARVAAALLARGLTRGDAVLVLAPMSIELYAALVGAFRAGLVAMVVDPGAARGQLDACLAVHAPRAFVGTPRAHLLRLVSPALRHVPHQLSIGRWVPGAAPLCIDAGDADGHVAHVQPDDGALLTFTSGSTGAPKPAMRSHAFLLAQHEVVAAHVVPQPGQVVMVALPIFVLSNLAAGATSIIPAGDLRRPASIDASRILRQLRARRAETLGASPAFFERLLDAGATFPDAERIHTGGAPVFPRTLRRLQAAAPRAQVVALYGSTEAEPIAALRARDVTAEDARAMASGAGLLVGEPVPQARVRVEDDEVLVTGPHVLKGYLGGRGDAETKVRLDGEVWHRTGDGGRFDERGRLWLLGRRSARIEDARGVVWPFAVETALSEKVSRSALVQHAGERVLVLEGDADVEPPALVDRIVRAKVPVDRRHNGKVDYPALRAMLDRLR